jgi:hypothetical protein
LAAVLPGVADALAMRIVVSMFHGALLLVRIAKAA